MVSICQLHLWRMGGEMTKYFCDRCGDERQQYRRVQVAANACRDQGRGVDTATCVDVYLCDTCIDALKRWLKEAK
jgi:hypothetical protein